MEIYFYCHSYISINSFLLFKFFVQDLKKQKEKKPENNSNKKKQLMNKIILIKIRLK